MKPWEKYGSVQEVDVEQTGVEQAPMKPWDKYSQEQEQLAVEREAPQIDTSYKPITLGERASAWWNDEELRDPGVNKYEGMTPNQILEQEGGSTDNIATPTGGGADAYALENEKQGAESVIQRRTQELLQSNPDMTYREASAKARDSYQGDVAEVGTDVALSLVGGGALGLAARAGKAVGFAAPAVVSGRAAQFAANSPRLANAAKYAGIGATDAITAGTVGNLVAGRDATEGWGTDAALGGSVGGLVGGLTAPSKARIEAKAADYAEARRGVEGSAESIRQADELRRVQEVLDQEAGIASRVESGKGPEIYGSSTEKDVYKKQAAEAKQYSTNTREGDLLLLKTERDDALDLAKAESDDTLNTIRGEMDIELQRSASVPNLKKAHSEMMESRQARFREENRNTPVEGKAALRDAFTAKNQELTAKFEAELASIKKAPDVRKQYQALITEQKEALKQNLSTVNSDYAKYMDDVRDSYKAAEGDVIAASELQAKQIVDGMADDFYRRAYQGEVDKLDVNTRPRLSESDITLLQREMGGRSAADMRQIDDMARYVDDSLPTYSPRMDGQFDADVYNIPPNRMNWYDNYGGSDRLESIIRGKEEAAVLPRQEGLLEEMALADLMETGLKGRLSADLSKLDSAGILSKIGRKVESGVLGGITNDIRNTQFRKVLKDKTDVVSKTINDNISKINEQLSGRAGTKAERAELEKARKGLENLRKQLEKGEELTPEAIARGGAYLDQAGYKELEDMIGINRYINRYSPEKKSFGSDMAVSRMAGLGGVAAGALTGTLPALVAGAVGTPIIREAATWGAKSDMINANQLSKLLRESDNVERELADAISGVRQAEALPNTDRYVEMETRRDILKAELKADPEYKKFNKLRAQKRDGSYSTKSDGEFRRLADKFKGAKDEISRLNKEMGGAPNKVLDTAKSTAKSAKARRDAVSKELKAKLSNMSEADQKKYLINEVLRNAERIGASGTE